MSTPIQPTASSPADETLDCTGLVCPLPIYKSVQVLARLAPGQTLRIVCTDPGSLEDFPALARRGGHDLLRFQADGGVQTFWLRKGAGR